MNSIKCNFCKKENLFATNKVRKSGKAEIIACNHCQRAITVSFNGNKYYNVVDK